LPGPALAAIIATRVLPSLFAALALLLASAPTEPSIRWSTTPACVDAARVPARVGELLGGASPPMAVLVLGAEPLERGQAGEDGWRITLELVPTEGIGLQRVLEGRDCATLTEAVALVVAVHLDAVATAAAVVAVPPVEARPQQADSTMPSEPTPPPVPRPVPPTVERSSPSRATATEAPPSLRARPRALASLAAAGELGVLPRGAIAFELAGGVGWSHARVELGALASLGPDATSERLPAVGGRFRLSTGSLRGCGVPARERVELPLCGGLELGDLRATGTGLQRPATVDALWLAAVASARPQWSPWPRLAVGALLDLVVPLRRHRFATPEAGLVHVVDPVAVRLGVRVELRLP
jgi:hypothetical protein